MSYKFDDKGFVFRSGPSKVQKNQYSSFWINNNNDDEYDELFGTEKNKGRDLVQLASYKRAISNFVNIVTGETIPVVFNSKDESYTNGKKVVIGSNLTDKNFDVAVGLALHEGSHIKLSDFDFLRHLETNIPQEIYNLGETMGVPRMEIVKTVKSILNYVEDRRIDYFIFSSSPGYKGYYNSMYDKYFYSKNVDKGLLSSEFRTEEIDSYMFRIINLHNKNRQLGALKGLREIYDIIDLRNIQRLRDTNDCFNISCEVMSQILLNIDKIEVSDSDESQGQGGSSDNTMSDEEFDSLLDSIENGDSMSSSDSTSTGDGKTIDVPVQGSPTTPDENLPNDDGSESVELSDRQKELLKKAFQKQEKFLDGDIQKTKMSKKDSNDIKAIDESGAGYETVGKDVPNYYGSTGGSGTKCLVVKNLTQSIIDSDQFRCASSYNQRNYNSDSEWRRRNYNFVEEGMRIGTMLGRKLQVRNEENVTKYTRKDSGRLDKRLISELGFGNSNVFSQTFVDKFNKVFVHLSIDASGSMCGSKWNKAMTSAVAMIKASDMVGNIEVVVSIRTTHDGNNSRSGSVPFIMVCYDSRKDNLTKVRKLFPALDVSGTTPEGLCFESIMDELIPGTSSQDSYFINYSDGQPYYGNNDISYSGERAERHTKKMVDMMRAKGIKVLSYFIGDSDYSYESDKTAFSNMYGSDSEFVNVTNVVDVARTMNKRFLTK